MHFGAGMGEVGVAPLLHAVRPNEQFLQETASLPSDACVIDCCDISQSSVAPSRLGATMSLS